MLADQVRCQKVQGGALVQGVFCEDVSGSMVHASLRVSSSDEGTGAEGLRIPSACALLRNKAALRPQAVCPVKAAYRYCTMRVVVRSHRAAALLLARQVESREFRRSTHRSAERRRVEWNRLSRAHVPRNAPNLHSAFQASWREASKELSRARARAREIVCCDVSIGSPRGVTQGWSAEEA